MAFKAAGATELGWAACAIDAEGTITHCPTGTGNRSYVRVEVFNTDPRFVLEMKRLFAFGSVTWRQRVDNRTHRMSRRSYTWAATSRQAEQVLRVILPYLVIKREQAELALAICATMRGSRARGEGGGRGKTIPVETLALRNDLSARLRVVKAARPTLEEVS